MAIGAAKMSFTNGIVDVYYRHIKHSILIGDITAFVMNSKLLEEIQADKGAWSQSEVMGDFIRWLGFDKILFGGKNVHFDISFLKRVYGWEKVKHYHRYLDLGNLCYRPGDKVPPSLPECIERLGLEWEHDKHHNALYDARMAGVGIVKALSTRA